MTLITLTDNFHHIRDAFENSPIDSLRKLEVENDGDSILISGKVDSFYHKQLAQEVVRNFSQEIHVVNTVEVGE